MEQEVTLRDAQMLMLSILKDVDRICRENNIKYWIESGTLLGAVRHKGFIPWDDDVDIGMARADYERFREIIEDKLPGDLYYQDIFRGEGIQYGWCKIRHKHSRIIEEKDAKYHEGIFIDIFPYDFYQSESENDQLVKLKKEELEKYRLIYNSLLDYEKDFLKNIKKNFKRCGCKFYNKFILKKSLQDIIIGVKKQGEKLAEKGEVDNKATYLGYGIEVLTLDYFIEKKYIFPLKEIDFEGIRVKCPNDNHQVLKKMYGENYMELPKVEDRYYHNLGLEIEKQRD